VLLLLLLLFVRCCCVVVRCYSHIVTTGGAAVGDIVELSSVQRRTTRSGAAFLAGDGHPFFFSHINRQLSTLFHFDRFERSMERIVAVGASCAARYNNNDNNTDDAHNTTRC
jgi:hypothetical protein